MTKAKKYTRGRGVFIIWGGESIDLFPLSTDRLILLFFFLLFPLKELKDKVMVPSTSRELEGNVWPQHIQDAGRDSSHNMYLENFCICLQQIHNYLICQKYFRIFWQYWQLSSLHLEPGNWLWRLGTGRLQRPNHQIWHQWTSY